MIVFSTSSNQKYSKWFVLQVVNRKEYVIKNVIEKYSEKSIEIIIFSKEIQRCRNGSKKMIIHPLFPGYLFIRQDIQTAIDIIKKRLKDDFMKPVCFKNEKCRTCFTELSPCMVDPEEMELLLNTSDSSRIFRVSRGYKKGDDIVIINGPLKYLRGNILDINEKKGFVHVALLLFKREIQVALGIEFIRKQDSV